jgi:predicted lipoprotein with Yx(FWY)xxD motif
LNRSSCERDTDNNSRNDIIKPYPIPTQNSEEPINAYDFATIKREDSKLQTAYKGRPLYLYKGDSNPGDINGQGLNKMWFIASP